MSRKNQGLLIVLFIVAIVAVWYFTRPSSSPSSSSSSSSSSSAKGVLGLGEPLVNKNGAKFTNIKSKFGEDTSSDNGVVYNSVKTYPDGKPISKEYIFDINAGGNRFPDGTIMPDFNIITRGIGMCRMFKDNNNKFSKLYTDNQDKLTEFSKIKDYQTFEKMYKTFSNDLLYAFAQEGLIILLSFAQYLTEQLQKCSKPDSPCTGALVYNWVMAKLFNIDILNNYSTIGNGFDYYTFSKKISKDTDVTPSGITFGKSVKSISLVLVASEQTTGAASQLSINVNGTDYSLGDTTWIDDRSGYNYNINVLNIEYPITLNSLKISVTCPGTSVDIAAGMLLVVYV